MTNLPEKPEDLTPEEQAIAEIVDPYPNAPPIPEDVVACMDCRFHNQWDGVAYECTIEGVDKRVCRHWTPEYWIKTKSFRRDWGDASLCGKAKGMEMLRKEDVKPGEVRYSSIEYLLLAPLVLRRPAVYYADGPDVRSWGRY